MPAREDHPGSHPTAVRWRDEIRTSAPPCLVVIYGAELGRRLVLGDTPVTLGRDPGCDLVAEVDEVSREHCRLSPRAGTWYLSDLRSTNGTWIDDARVETETPLATGARIRIGNLILKFLEGGDVESLYHEEIYRLTILDGLTGLYNRRYFDEFLHRELARFRRYGQALSLVLLDVDDFKRINDTYGHPGGDAVLLQLAREVKSRVRQESCLARLAGDELAVVLPETTAPQARIFAERLRGFVDVASFRAGDVELGELTISLGLAEMEASLVDAGGLIEAADRNLYRAKAEGRNRVCG